MTDDKITLPDLLSLYDKLDDEILEFPSEVIEKDFADALKEQQLQKIDSYGSYLEYLNNSLMQNKAKLQELQTKVRHIENKIDSFRKGAAFIMQKFGYEKLPGTKYNASISRSVGVETNDIPENYIDLYPNLISAKTSYSWNKSEIKKVLQRKTLSFAQLKTTSRIVLKEI